MRKTSVIFLLGVIFASGCAEELPPGPPLDMRHTTKDLMAGMIDASADALWDAVGTVWDENGENHWEPETEEQWLAVKGAAMTLVESGNLLMLGERAIDDDQWMVHSQALVDAGAIALAAAEARDPARVFDTGEVVYNACNSCHSIYWVGDEARGRTSSE